MVMVQDLAAPVDAPWAAYESLHKNGAAPRAVRSGDIPEHWQARDILRQHVESSEPMTAGEWDWTLRVFDHVQLNASDYTASVRFYETVLSALGIPKIAEHEQGAWDSAWTDFTDLNVLDRRPPTTNLHLCFYARSREQVDAFHRAGVEAGFRSNGAPGYRDYGPGYYAAYLLDPDGNNVEALYRDVGNIGHGEGAALH